MKVRTVLLGRGRQIRLDRLIHQGHRGLLNHLDLPQDPRGLLSTQRRLNRLIFLAKNQKTVKKERKSEDPAVVKLLSVQRNLRNQVQVKVQTPLVNQVVQTIQKVQMIQAQVVPTMKVLKHHNLLKIVKVTVVSIHPV